ncbi:penicillin-binding protein 1C [Elioraea sp. Yellowstone]|jgi:penicillin-binding protein 1C|uniref:penicillin-binding protein 1C n=1 Tax=Elioraea sp. Yellowstone TaxID=2592070 RepID=UPI00114F04E0|nr:penicillin-binding protein 1C [Elioraea sp. Yellowstone]TQF79630.1 penicillin-binding protein 1C [Elioraea sp. Yellowstone]
MRRAALALALLVAGIAGLDRLFPPNLSRAEAVSAEVTDRDGATLAVFPAPGGVWRLRTTVADVPPAFVAMLLAREDARFRWHPGADPLALARAAAQAARHGRIVSGGSTITMQVARLLEPRPRTVLAKVVEIARACQLEVRYSKDEILGLWLTLAPFGGNLEGVRAAALALFGRPPAGLDPAELALLVALPQRPSALRPDRFPERAAAARDRVLDIAEAAGALSPRAAADARAAPVEAARHAMPRLAWHLAVREAGGGRVATTLEAPLQAALERLGAEIAATLDERANLAVVVLRNADRTIAAHLGALPGETRGGALDLAHAVRSPGSSFKPFLYALAFDAGAVRPETRIADLPRRFDGYAPENFDRGFVGDVTAAEALRLSLNLPAVAVADAFGPLAFVAALGRAGAPPRFPPAQSGPGLPVALGGFGTTLMEATALAAALADDGSVAAPVWRAGKTAARQPFVSREAAGAVRAILAGSTPPPGMPPQLHPPRIAWKTGTSWGHRDAWALGVSATHTVGVWVGRPDGTPLPGQTGRATATPLMLRVFALLPDPGPLPDAPPLPPAPALARLGPASADRLRLIFPPDGAALAAGAAVTLRAAGGQRPLTWLVDGAPIASVRHRRDTAWQPPGPGFYRITVVDAEGAAAVAELRVRSP